MTLDEYERAAVQPRVCGERARGVGILTAEHRFSPACAGNGTGMKMSIRAHPVQPRVCGERTCERPERHAIPGSAPRVRGTVPYLGAVVSGLRFSPACAGNGRFTCKLPARRPVQPRVCGERDLTTQLPLFFTGSAPRVRGTAMLGRHHGLPLRFSPACAGNGA